MIPGPACDRLAHMVELFFFIWLLGATIVFVSVAMTGEAREPSEALWLLMLAATWPFIALFMILGAAFVALSAWSRAKGP
jgi:hypothetical protein